MTSFTNLYEILCTNIRCGVDGGGDRLGGERGHFPRRTPPNSDTGGRRMSLKKNHPTQNHPRGAAGLSPLDPAAEGVGCCP